MVTFARRAARIRFAPVAAGMFGVACAILVLATPHALFDSAIVATGLPGVVPAAQPPLGMTARLLTTVLAFGLVTLALWAAFEPIEHRLDARRRARTPWRDAGYDVPIPAERFARRPISAEELGAPLMSDAAITAKPFEVDPVLAAPVETSAAPLHAEDGDDSIQALIRRLESGLSRRAPNDPGPGSANVLPLNLPREWIIGLPGDAGDIEGREMNVLQRLAIG